MTPDYYKDIDYWKRYLPFIPKKYQDSFVVPDEAYWKWNNEKIHYDYKSDSSHKAIVILIHGAGGNGRILSILGSYLFQNEINYYSPDNLGYGLTKISNNNFEYKDWVSMISDFTRFVMEQDKKPVILIGMSIGGMLAYHIACKVRGLKGLIVTTLADPRDEETLMAVSKNKVIGKYGLPIMNKFRMISDRIRLPIKWFCSLILMSRDPQFSKVFIKDKHAGGVTIPLKFLRTLGSYKPEVKFSEFDSCPILLLHPEKDFWTPFHLSKKVYDKLPGRKEYHLLKECGHAPIEEPGIYEMERHALDFIKRLIDS